MSQAGLIVLNPASLPEENFDRLRLAMMLSATTLVLLPGWRLCSQTLHAKALAEALGMEVVEWAALRKTMAPN